jgi:hypothetical protein
VPVRSFFGAGAIVLFLLVGVGVAFFALRGGESSIAAPPPPTTTEPAPTPTPTPTPIISAAAPTKFVDHWKLKGTTCGATVPLRVETTHDGAAIVTRAKGFPDSVGTVSPDGTFTVTNARGTCRGMSTPNLVTETCTSPQGLSCSATYERAD